MATINLGAIKFNWQGAYAGGTAYAVDDVVSYNGSSYVCILASTGNLPTNATYFEQMSSAGTNGTNGTDLTTTLTTQGDLVYRDGSGLQRLGAGTSGQFLKTNGSGANPAWATLSDSFGSQLLYVRDEKSAGVDGGTATAGSFNTRELNTVVTNEISGASLASNQITLPSGTYFIIATIPSYSVEYDKVKLRNITDSTDTLIGTSSYSAVSAQQINFIFGRFTIGSTKTFEIQHRVGLTQSTYGLALSDNYGVTEVYTNSMIWKVA